LIVVSAFGVGFFVIRPFMQPDHKWFVIAQKPICLPPSVRGLTVLCCLLFVVGCWVGIMPVVCC
jgi:hypothetical protein